MDVRQGQIRVSISAIRHLAAHVDTICSVNYCTVHLACEIQAGRSTECARLLVRNTPPILSHSLTYFLPYLSKKAIPTAVSTAVDIGFSNWSLKLITLSLYSQPAFSMYRSRLTELSK